MSAATISVIYVSWHDTKVVSRALERLSEVVVPDDAGLEVIVVVNEAVGSDEGTIVAARSGTVVISNPDNKGFGPACNQAAAFASGDILLFLNPDTLARPGLIDGVFAGFAAEPGAVAIAPRLVDADSSVDTQRLFQLRRLPTLWTDARELLLLDQLWPGNPGQRHARYLDRDRERPFAVEQAAAAALAVRRDVFEAVGGFDERFVPAYWEDVDLCRRLAARGAIVYWPTATLEHSGGAAVAHLGPRRFYRMYYGNALRYRAKHYPLAARIAYRLLLVLGMVARAMVTPWLSRGQPVSRGAARGFLDVIGLALRPTGERGTP